MAVSCFSSLILVQWEREYLTISRKGPKERAVMNTTMEPSTINFFKENDGHTALPSAVE